MLRFVFMLLVTIGSVQAAYITDKLLVGFYAKPNASAQPTKVLPSSTPMEVLGKKDAFSKVRLGDGKEGWVKTIYISTEKPARAMLLELQAKSSAIQNKLLQAQKALKAAKAGGAAPADSKAVAKLQQELAQTKKRLVAMNNALKNEQKQTRRLSAQLKKSSSKGSNGQSKQVKVLKKKLSSSEAELKATLHEARLLQDLLKKTDQTASQRIAALEVEVIKAKKSQNNSANVALKQQNAIIKKRLQQLSDLLGQPLPEVKVVPVAKADADPKPEPESVDQVDGESGYGFGTWAFFLTLLLIGGFVGGIAFKNHHIRRRYGGFRI